MITTKKNILFLFFIFVISFFIRFIFSQSTPLLWDEAALGYNAYSIIKTGKDEYGSLLPVIFKSFGDYKPGLYVYLCLPFVYLFGLTEFSVRLPSIILGSLLPLVLYWLIKEINPKAHKTAIISAIVMVFNPYNIHFSAGAWETNVLTIELVLASYLFFKYINLQKIKYSLLSAIVFGLSLYTYQAGKMISLLLIIILFLINLRLINIKKIFLSFILPLGLIALPIAFGLIFNNNSNRLQVISLFSYPRSSQETQTIIKETNQQDYNLFHNHYLFFTRGFLLRYFNHYSSKFLAFEGDWQSPRHSAPYTGVILYPSLVFLIGGFFFALSRKKLDKLNLFFLLWLLVAPIPAALTRDSLQAVRSMSLSIPLIYFISYGIFIFFDKYNLFLLKGLVVSLYLISFVYYSDLYFNHMVTKSPYDFLYGYKQATEYVIKNQHKYDRVVFSDFFGQPYIFYLFYSQYPPTNYQKKASLVNNTLDTGKVASIDKIKFETPSFETTSQTPKTLAIFSQEEIYRQGIDKKPEFSQFIPLSPIGNISTFYAYENP